MTAKLRPIFGNFFAIVAKKWGVGSKEINDLAGFSLEEIGDRHRHHTYIGITTTNSPTKPQSPPYTPAYTPPNVAKPAATNKNPIDEKLLRSLLRSIARLRFSRGLRPPLRLRKQKKLKIRYECFALACACARRNYSV